MSRIVTFKAEDDRQLQPHDGVLLHRGHDASEHRHRRIDDTVECDGSGNTEALNAWLNSNGGAAASDICGNVTWTNDFEGLSDDCGATGSATVIFTATDDCGNASTTSATFTIEDTTDPSIDTAASDETVECDGSGNTAALNAWLADNGGAEATDAM